MGVLRGEESCFFFSPHLPEVGGRVYCCSGYLPQQCLQVQPKEPQTKLGQPEVLSSASAFLPEHSCPCTNQACDLVAAHPQSSAPVP